MQFVRTLVQKIALKLFNRAFSCCVDPKHIESVKLLADENIKISTDNIESIRLLTESNIQIKIDDIELLTLFRHCMGSEKLRLFKTFLSDNPEIFRKLDISFLEAVKKISLLNRLGDIDDISEGVPLCYSQEGEGLILDRIFNLNSKGFFVDVGAHHPKRFSNTYALYKRGWRGINIDPTPGAKELFEQIRPEDIFLPVAVSDNEDEQDFYIFEESALNTFNGNLAEEYQHAGWELTEVRTIKSVRLASLLETLQLNTPIDLISIDVEDHELQVLRSNHWTKYRPTVLVVEILNFDLNKADRYPVHNFIVEKGYQLFAKTYNTLFYKDAS